MRYAVWWEDKHYSEKDATHYEAEFPEDAAREHAESKYAWAQHVDPGRMFVRCPNGDLKKFAASVVVRIDVLDLGSGN